MRTPVAVISLAAVAAAGAAGYSYWRTHEPVPPTIVTGVLTRGSVVDTVDATGTLEAVTTVQVGTQVSGTIKSLAADFNSRVRRGQVIAELDSSLFETQVEQARATVMRLEAEAQRAIVQLDDARHKLKRARELAARQLISASDLEAADVNARQAEAALKAADAQIVQARASLNQSQVNLAHTIITAPIDGIVISRNVDVGQTVAASMQAPTLFVIARDLKAMQVNASIAESDIGRIQPGQSVMFRVDAYPDRLFTGTVSQVRLDPVVEQNVVSYITVIEVPNPDLTLKPGMTANVTVEIDRADNVLRVPNAALRVRPSAEMQAMVGAHAVDATTDSAAGDRLEPAVWIRIEGRLERIAVRTGLTDGVHTAVFSSALDEGMEVVTSIPADTARAATASSSPLLPSRGRGIGGRGTGAGGPPGP